MTSPTTCSRHNLRLHCTLVYPFYLFDGEETLLGGKMVGRETPWWRGDHQLLQFLKSENYEAIDMLKLVEICFLSFS